MKVLKNYVRLKIFPPFKESLAIWKRLYIWDKVDQIAGAPLDRKKYWRYNRYHPSHKGARYHLIRVKDIARQIVRLCAKETAHCRNCCWPVETIDIWRPDDYIWQEYSMCFPCYAKWRGKDDSLVQEKLESCPNDTFETLTKNPFCSSNHDDC